MGRFLKTRATTTRKPEHAQDRLRLEPGVVVQLKKKIMGRVETKTILTQDELKVIQEQGEKEARDHEAAVTDTQIDKNVALTVYNTQTGERSVIVPKPPPLTYYQKYIYSLVTIQLCRRFCFISSILLIMVNTYFLVLWVYADYHWPLEFFRVMFEKENARINRIALEFKLNLFLSLLSLVYSLWGMSVSTVFTCTPLVTGYFTWSVMFILCFLTFLGVHVYNLSRIRAAVLKNLLFQSLWTFGYYTGSYAERMSWNQAQFSLECCGVYGYKDWYVDWGYWVNRTDKPIEQINQHRFPESCCPSYNLQREFRYVVRTRPYSIRMLYCQYFPIPLEGCFLKLIEFFQFFTRQLIWVSVVQAILMTSAAGWAFGSHVRYKLLKTKDKLYYYTWKDWIIDFFFIRAFKSIKDKRRNRIGPAPLHLEYDSVRFDENFLEQRRPRLIEDLPTKIRHLEEDEEEAKLDEEARKEVLPLIRDPIVEIVIDDKDTNLT